MANLDLVVLGVVALVAVGASLYLWNWFRGRDRRVRSDLQPIEDRPAAAEPEWADPEPEIASDQEIAPAPDPVPVEPVRLVPPPEEPEIAQVEPAEVLAPAAAVAATPPPVPPPAPVPAPAPAPAPAPVTALRYVAPANPETAELERRDPRHAAARRLARLSVSEIKLYREADVKAGREAGDLWRRLQSDITMALQMFEKRVDQEVRERFDYFYDELVRQLAAGDASKLGIDAPARRRGNAV